MAGSNRINRPYVRKRRTTEPAKGSGAARLAGMAGGLDRASVDTLERRQMLFALTVTPNDIDPATGLGTVRGFFGYVIPNLIPTTLIQPDNGQPRTGTEPFDQANPGVVGNGAFMPSGLQIRHNVTPAADLRIDPPDAQQNARYLRTVLDQTGEFVTFQFFDVQNNVATPFSARQVTFAVLADGPLDSTGLETDRMIVELLRTEGNGTTTVIASFTGANLRAQFQAGGLPANGIGTLQFNGTNAAPAFDSFRIRATSTPGFGVNPAFRIDNIVWTLPPTNFVAHVERSIFGAEVNLTGPVGARAEFRDLYGGDIVQTIALKQYPNSQVLAVDPDGDGRPNFNPGIGSIRFSGVDSRTSFAMWGGTIETATQDPGNADFFDGSFAFTLKDDLVGLFNEFEAAGFGYIVVPQQGGGAPQVRGLPPGPGSVIIGSPFVRAQNRNPQLIADPAIQGGVVRDGFVRADQGLFIDDGSSMGSISIHGVVHGSSRFTGFVDRLAVGYLVGSVTVEGDLGQLIVGTDAGLWALEPAVNVNGVTDRIFKTAGQLLVGRTLGEFMVAGRQLMDITVLGDINSPTTRPARDAFTYYEKEYVLGLDLTTTNINTVRQNLRTRAVSTRTAGAISRPGDQAQVFGGSFYRNDNIMSAEYIGGATGAVRIQGDLSGRDPFNQSDDSSDVFAFVADGSQDVVFENIGFGAGSLRIVDVDGRTIAAPSLRYNQNPTRSFTQQFRFRPTQAGVYYLVVADSAGATETGVGATPYSISVTGLVPSMVGALRSGAGFGNGALAQDGTTVGNTVTVLTGDVGMISVGTAFTDGSGQEVAPTSIINTRDGADDSMTFQGGTFSIAGTLYNLTTGGDIGASGVNQITQTIRFDIGGNLGTLITGKSPVSGSGSNEGDLNFLRLNVGGSIGSILVQGGIGMDQDATDPRAPVSTFEGTQINTGLNGGRGDIGFFRTGFHIAADSVGIHVTPGSTIGALLVSQDTYADGNARSGIYGGNGIPIVTGAGSDVRFFDTPRLDVTNSVDLRYVLLPGVPVELIDDGGARVRVTLTAGTDASVTGFVIASQVDRSQGVAIGRVSANLIGGATLTIDSQAPAGTTPGQPGEPARGGTVGVGRIEVTNADAFSAILLTGSVQIDVYRIIQTGGDAFGLITNETIGGDIVSADVASLNTLTISHGNLGSTQVPAWGPQRIGPFLGIAAGLVQDPGGALGILVGGIVDDDFNGNVYRPVNSDDYAGGNASFDDIGAPLDPFLNGIVVRNGDVTSVTVSGSVGDVILQGATARLGLVTANSDLITAVGAFDGIVGNIYAFDIATVDIGDGLARPDQAPLLSVGIVAGDDIGTIQSSVRTGVIVHGVILASNADPLGGAPAQLIQGVEAITLTNASVQDALVSAENADGFWKGINYGDDNAQQGDIGTITLATSSFFRSRINGTNIGAVTFTSTVFDASEITATGNIDAIRVTSFRNSTLLGDVSEYFVNFIGAAGSVRSITALEDVQDLIIDINGSVLQGITARHIVRTNIDVDNLIQSITTTGSFRASQVFAGEVPTFTIAGDIINSELAISGILRTVSADRIINSRLAVTGPDGALQNVTARGVIDGEISASGPITSVTSTAGDITAFIKTTTLNGNVGTLSAARDLAITADVSGTISNLIAGRHIGDATKRGVITIKGDLARATVPGQLYADLRVGGAVTGPVTIGRVVSKPERNSLGTGSIVAFGNISSVSVTGDFNGDIISYSGNVSSVSITDGSFLPGHTIAAYDGDIVSVTITNGNLYGNVYADYDIRSVRVVASADGVFGDVGVSGVFSQYSNYDAFRNQAPVGVDIDSTKQGPRIAAGQDIVSFVVTNGTVYEASFQAGRAIRSISINGDVRNDAATSGVTNVFAAGDSIDNVSISGAATDVAFLAGAVDLGSDGLAGGIGVNADRYKSGSLDRVSVGRGVNNALVVAGITPGGDGLFNTADDRAAIGTSLVNQLAFSGTVTNVTVLGDSLSGGVANDGRFAVRRSDFLADNLNADSGAGSPGVQFTGSRTFNFGGGTVTLNLSGAGTAFFDTLTGRATLRGTNSGSNFTVTSSLAALNNFDVVTNDDASLNSLSIAPRLTGDSDIFVDGGVSTLALAQVDGTGDLTIGGDVGNATFAALTGGFFSARNIATLNVNGDFGNANSAIFNEARISALSGGTFNFRAGARAAVSVDRSVTAVNVTGLPDRSAFRFGGSLGSFNAPGLSRSVLSVGNTLSSVTLSGEMFDSAVLAGVDLGTDSAFGGSGTAADRTTTGFIGSVAISGNFRESDIVTGYYRGPDAFYGTADDTVAPGLGTIGAVSISGSISGSTRLSESYLIGASGIIGNLTVGGVPFSGTLGNFHTEQSDGLLAPSEITLNDIVVTYASRQFIANLTFNQPIDGSTLSKGMQISELRGDQNTLIRLVEGVDYTISYDGSTNTARVLFNVALTARNLPQVPGAPGPGVFRFELLQDTIRGKSLGNRTDGNGDGFSALRDNISQDVVVGDAGDKFNAESVTGTSGGRPVRVDFYAPANLDWVLDNNSNPDGLPDTNRVYTVRGVIGDHPDNDNNFFRFSNDLDVYSITLQAGQIIRLGAMQGAAANAPIILVDANGNPVGSTFNILGQAIPASALALPVETSPLGTFVNPQAYLIKVTGNYKIVVGNANTYNTPGTVPNADPVAAGTGEYRFTLEVFDDGDSGFSGAEDPGNGTLVTPAPAPIAFAGIDGLLNTADDLSEIINGTYTFVLSKGTDGVAGTADDVVSGVSAEGVTSTTFADGRQVQLIEAAIGNPGHVGVPNRVTADVDVFHLNNRAPITPGTKLKITVKLAEGGADLGSLAPLGLDITQALSPTDRRGSVQFGLFDTSTSTGPSDANLVFSPTDFSANGGTPNTVIADNGKTKYGYDANGDFYIEFVAPDRIGAAGQAGTFAIYLQGILNTDYQIEVVSNGTDALPTPQRQNFFIETNGGSVNWLQAGGLTTNIGGFFARTLGFNGIVANGLDAQAYILSNLVASLNALFQSSNILGSGYDVHFSTNPAEFEFQPFSTIFLTSNSDPVSVIFDSFFPLNPLAGSGLGNNFFSTQPYGFSEHSDPFNADVEDEGVVFAPSFGNLGLTPGKAGVDRFVQSLTASVARRAGELMGLRVTADNNITTATLGAGFDPFAADSVQGTPGQNRAYSLSQTARALSGVDSIEDTNFFLGQQDSRSLLDKILGRI